MSHPPVRLRYRGSIAPLFELWAILDVAGMTLQLLRGPTPDVTVLVHPPDDHDALYRFHESLFAWRSRFGAEAEAEVVAPGS